MQMSPYRVLLFCFLIYLGAFFFYQRWTPNILYGGDSWGYYAYLPAFLLNQDLENLDTTYAMRQQKRGTETGDFPDFVKELPNGKRLIKYTSGLAMLQLPAFIVGHFIAAITGLPQDGYSWPYLFMVHLWTLLLVYLGLIAVLRIWENYFDKPTLLWLLISLLLGTNLFFSTVYHGSMAHAPLFALYLGLIVTTERFYANLSILKAALLGLLVGWISLIRPSEAICILIPLLWGIYNRKSISERFLLLQKHWPKILASIGAGLLIWLPQLIYWESLTGEWVYYSYGEEGFDFSDPQVWKGWFSFKNGWLIYTPIMVLSFIGFWLPKVYSKWALPSVLFFILHTYIIYSWWCWYYIYGFGSRPMVEAYSILAFPLGATIQWLRKKRLGKALLVVLVLPLIMLNLFQSYQHDKGIIWTEAMNSTYYQTTFGRVQLDKAHLVEFDSDVRQPRDLPLEGRLLLSNDMEKDIGSNYIDSMVCNGKQSFLLSADNRFGPAFYLDAEDWELEEGDYLRIRFMALQTEKEGNLENMARLIVQWKQDEQQVNQYQVRIGNKLGNDKYSLWWGKKGVWDEVVFWLPVWVDADKNDQYTIFTYNDNGKAVLIDDFQIEYFRSR